MAKQRVYELARELGHISRDVLERAVDLGIEVTSASSGLDDDAVALIRLSYAESRDDSDVALTVPEEATADTAVENPEEQEDGAEKHDEEAVEEYQAEPARGDRIITVDEGVTAPEFARLVGTRTGEIVRRVLAMGEVITGSMRLPVNSLESLGRELGYAVTVVEAEQEPEQEVLGRSIVEFVDDPSALEARPPVVTVMGHVDHGKTQLLDVIRQADVTAGEAGGITQHIGAYQVTRGSEKLTFIDTPGHEAFTALRARGADVTDIAIIVIAADDGVMPQTVEAIDHVKSAGVPIIIAINKMDLEAADPHSARAELTGHGILVEELGGDVVSAEISALSGDGVDALLEMVLLVAEVSELTANPRASAVGTVIESHLDVGRGPLGTVIVQRGTLRRGDVLVVGAVAGRVRAMFDENGNRMKEAGPSTPVVVMGWDEIPVAGDMFEVVHSEREARKLAKDRADKLRSEKLTTISGLERFALLQEQLRTADHAELRLIVKADTHGSLEAIRDAVLNISREDGRVTLVHGAVGGITSNDVTLAGAADAVVYGFNTRPDTTARKTARDHSIEIRTFDIIYELLDDVETALVAGLSPEKIETFLGVAEVRETFRAPRFGLVAGCVVTEGEIQINARARLVRDGVVIHDRRIGSLRRFKDDVQSVQAGLECGIGFENFRDIKEGDTIESFETREVVRT